MAEREKNQNNTAAENNEQKPEKKMTRYDLKMQRRREEELRQQKRKKYSMAIVAAVVLVCVCVLGWKFYDSYQEKHGEYVAIGDHSVKKAEYDYYYYSSVNSFAASYGNYISYFGLDLSQPLDQQYYSENMTWKDYFDQQTVEQLKNVYALTDEAKTNGFEYDATEDYDQFVESVKSGAESQDVSADEYCKSLFGSYATIEGLKPYISNSSMASAYYESIEDATEVTEDEINTYYDENKSSYDSVDYRICRIAADMPEDETEAASETESAAETQAAGETASSETETAETMSEEEKEAAEAAKEAAEEAAMAEAKAKADEMLDKITDEASFETLCKEYATDTATDSLNTNMKKSSVSPSAVGDWLFDDARQAGDKTVIEYETGNAYYVVYFLDRYLEHAKTVDVRHILISSSVSTDTDTETEATGETESEEAAEESKKAAQVAAKAKADEVYDEWKNGEATEDSFAALAETYSDDTGSNTNGGLYEAVKEGTMVTNFNDWIFDDARQPGDTDIVESDYGYHIVYFVGDNAEEWQVDIESTLLNNKMTDYMTSIKEGMEVVDKRGHIGYLHIPETEATESGTGTDGTENGTEAASETTSETADEGAETETTSETES